MWVLTASFDGEQGDFSFQKTKLLKTGTSYVLGRKDQPLIINSKKVSHEHCEFIVGKYTAEDVANPGTRPSLDFVNKRTKPMKLFRGGQELALNPCASAALENDDIVAIVTDLPVKVQWLPISCYQSHNGAKSSQTSESCATLGINLVHDLSLPITHHITQTVSASPSIAASLLSLCHFVKLDWLAEIVRLGNLPRNPDSSSGVSLEENFVLPPINKYRPTFSPSLPPALKVFKVWEPNEERLNLFNGIRFLFVGEKGREIDSLTRDAVVRGGAEYEMFDVNSGQAKWHQVLTKGIRRLQDGGKAFVVVGDEPAMQAALGDDGWNELHSKLQSCGLEFLDRDSIVQAVLSIDISRIIAASSEINFNADSPSSSPIPSFVPNTLPEAPSIPQLPSSLESSAVERQPDPVAVKRPARLTRRATSRQPSQEPFLPRPQPSGHSPSDITEGPEPEAPQPRKALTRRAKAGAPTIVGIDDVSLMLDVSQDVSIPEPPILPGRPPSSTAPTPRRTRLKRRVGTQVDEDLLALPELPETVEPPLKKFKALFEASDPDRLGVGSAEDYDAFTQDFAITNPEVMTQTQSESYTHSGRNGRGQDLGAILEEEETPSAASIPVDPPSRGTKRRATEANMETHTSQNLVKRRAAEDSNPVESAGLTAHNNRSAALVAVASRPPVSRSHEAAKKPGAEPGKPDQDTAFLQAVASMKRGKRKEDNFDREFNQLKISKPDLEADREEPEKEWDLLADFGDDSNVRGNFMVVVEMDVYRDEEPVRPRPRGQNQAREVLKPEWQNLPNFKKFKKKGVEAVQRTLVDLVISEDQRDYGMGAAYWKGGNSQSQPPTQVQESQDNMSSLTLDEYDVQASKRGKSRQVTAKVSDEDSDPVPAKRKAIRKPPSRAGSAAPTQRSTRSTQSAKPPAKSQPLFIDDSDDNDKINAEDDAENHRRLGEDDEEIARVQSGETGGTKNRPTTATRQSSRAKKVPVPKIVDDDSDDDAVFRGFQGKKRGR